MDRDHPTLRSALDEPSRPLRFGDILDVINPLQHIPIVSSIYRAITGDEIGGPARVLGGALFGGPFGLVAGIVDAIAAEANGADLGEIAIAAMFGEDEPGLAVAAAATDAGSGQPPLTGNAALQALAADLGGAGPTGSAPIRPAEPGAAARRRVATLGFNPRVDADRPVTPPPLSAFATQMLDGLDKYKALATARAREQAAAPRRLDESL